MGFGSYFACWVYQSHLLNSGFKEAARDADLLVIQTSFPDESYEEPADGHESDRAQRAVENEEKKYQNIPEGKEREKYLKIKGAKEVAEFVELIDFNAPVLDFESLCGPDTWFSFFKSGHFQTAIAGMGCSDFWWDHAGVITKGSPTSKSKRMLLSWLATHGLPEFQSGEEREEAEDTENALARNQFFNALQPLGRETLKSGAPQEIIGAFSSPKLFALSAFRAFGHPKMHWNGFSEEEMGLMKALDAISIQDVTSAIEECGGDSLCLNGAAFFAISGQSKHNLKAHLSKAELVQLASQILSGSAKYPALDTLEAIRHEKDQRLRNLVLRVARGSLGSFGSVDDRLGGNPSIRAAAYLTAASQEKSESLKDEIKRELPGLKRKSNKAALETALALLGEKEHFNPQYFRILSTPIGLSLLDAAAGYGRGFQIKNLAVFGMKASPGVVRDRSARTIQELTGVKLCKSDDWCMPDKNMEKVWWSSAASKPYR